MQAMKNISIHIESREVGVDEADTVEYAKIPDYGVCLSNLKSQLTKELPQIEKAIAAQAIPIPKMKPAVKELLQHYFPDWDGASR